jgi:hypothetical protein
VRALVGLSLVLIALGGCASAPPPLTIEENESSPIAGRGVGLGPITSRARFKQGKRVTVVLATLFIDERSAIRKQEVEVGDDFLVGSERWIVEQIVPGGATSRGAVVIRRAP